MHGAVLWTFKGFMLRLVLLEEGRTFRKWGPVRGPSPAVHMLEGTVGVPFSSAGSPTDELESLLPRASCVAGWLPHVSGPNTKVCLVLEWNGSTRTQG